MRHTIATIILLISLFVGCQAKASLPTTREELVQQVRAAETAFAKSMADRNFETFSSFVADDAVFLNDGQPLRGKSAVTAHWKRYFDAATAPFSWRPEIVEITLNGTLAQSTGPVFDAKGKLIARFYSTWRRENDGNWRVVLDNGYDVCECPRK